MRQTSYSLMGFLVCVAIGAGPTLVRAEPPHAAAATKSVERAEPKVSSSAAARRRAVRFTAAAEAAYHAEDFERASAAYQLAYASVPAPELLFNLGQCQRKLGRPERAVKYYEAYLRVTPDARQRQLVEVLIAEAKAVSAQPARRAPSAPAAAPSTVAAAKSPPPRQQPAVRPLAILPLPYDYGSSAPASGDHSAAPASALSTKSDYGVTQTAETDSPAVYERWWFWTGIGVVLAAGAATTAFVLLDADGERMEQPTLGSIRWE